MNLQYFECVGEPSSHPVSSSALVMLDGTNGGALRLTGIDYVNPFVGWVLFKARIIRIPIIPAACVPQHPHSLDDDGPMSRLRMLKPMAETPVEAYFALPIVFCALPQLTKTHILKANPFVFRDEEVRRSLRIQYPRLVGAAQPTRCPHCACARDIEDEQPMPARLVRRMLRTVLRAFTTSSPDHIEINVERNVHRDSAEEREELLTDVEDEMDG